MGNEIKYNTNNFIKFKLNNFGRSHLRKNIKKDIDEYGKIIKPHHLNHWLEENKIIKAQLHEFMNIFGEMYTNGGEIPTENNEIFFLKSNLEPKKVNPLSLKQQIKVLEDRLNVQVDLNIELRKFSNDQGTKINNLDEINSQNDEVIEEIRIINANLLAKIAEQNIIIRYLEDRSGQ